MNDLISRLSAATGPSRELDAEIALAKGWTKVRLGSEPCWRQPHADGTGTFHPQPPRYTESIDAALTLVPEDPANPGKPMLWSVSYDEDGVAGPRGYGASLSKGYHDPQTIYGYSEATSAIALVIACLKAKEDSKP